MAILQIGVPRSGNYWLYCILEEALRCAGIQRKSFVEKLPIYREALEWDGFSEQAKVDYLEITPKGNYIRKGSFQEKIEDIDAYIDQCSHVWTHSPWNKETDTVLPKFEKLVYIIRDPRDMVLSSASHAFTPVMLSQHPQFEQDPEKYLEHRFHELLLHWLDHVGGYLLQKDSFNIEIVFFERFLLSFDFQLEELIKYLDLKLERSHTATIKEQTSFELLKENNPYHLHRGTYGQWKDQLSSDQKSDADKIVGPMLELLGYPVKEEDFGSRLPTYPRESEPVIFKEARFAGRGNLYDQARYAISLLRSRRPFSEKLAKGMDYLLKKGRWDQSS